MAFSLPNNSQIAIAATYAASKTVSAISNAADAVATVSDATGLAAGDIVELTSGWAIVDSTVYRIKAINANAVTLEGLNTADTTKFPAGSGAGSLRKVSTWTQITQIDKWSFSGGEWQTTSIQPMDTGLEMKLKTSVSAMDASFSLFDDPSQPWYSALKSASDSSSAYAIKIIFPNGASMYFNAAVNFTGIPEMEKNNAMVNKGSFLLKGKPVRYAS